MASSETESQGSGLPRKLIVPALISAAGSAVGLLLTNRDKLREAAPKLREKMPDLPVPHLPEGGAGELTSDLRGKLDEVLGKEPAETGGGTSAESSVDHAELQKRRRARQESRNRRRQRSRR